MQLRALVLGISLGAWVASSCDTTHVHGYTAGNGVSGHSCPAVMKEGQTCSATCHTNSTSVGTIKCMGGDLRDVSMCVHTPLLDKLSAVDVTKVMGSWDLELDKQPSNIVLQSAVVSGMGVPKHFVECVWRGGAANPVVAGPHRVNYWVIVKPGMDPKQFIEKLSGFSNPNATQYDTFKTSLESFGMSMTSIKEVAEPLVVQSSVLKDPWGRNINPFGSSPGEGQGLDSWQ